MVISTFNAFADKIANPLVVCVDDFGWVQTCKEMIEGRSDIKSDFDQTTNENYIQGMPRQKMLNSKVKSASRNQLK